MTEDLAHSAEVNDYFLFKRLLHPVPVTQEPFKNSHLSVNLPKLNVSFGNEENGLKTYSSHLFKFAYRHFLGRWLT